MKTDELVKKGRIAELEQELKKLEAAADDELVKLKSELIPSFEVWEYNDIAIELRAKNLVKYIRKAKEIRAKLAELASGEDDDG